MDELFTLFKSDVGIGSAIGYSVLGLAIVFLMLIVLLFIIKLMVALLKRGEKAEPVAADAEISDVPPAPPAPPAPGSAGEVKLFDVPDRTAAMLMAIVADNMGKPLNELRFISIKEVNEDEV